MKKESSCLLLVFLIFTAVFSLIYGYFELGGNEMSCAKKFYLALILILLGIFILMLIFCEEDSQPKIVFDNNALFEKLEQKLYMFDDQNKADEKEYIVYVGDRILRSEFFKNATKIKKLYFIGSENKLTVELFNALDGKAQIIVANNLPLKFYEESTDTEKKEIYEKFVPVYELEPPKSINKEKENHNVKTTDFHINENISIKTSEHNENK